MALTSSNVSRLKTLRSTIATSLGLIDGFKLKTGKEEERIRKAESEINKIESKS
jgi:hypothetical protein